jgi:hypothetical protein
MTVTLTDVVSYKRLIVCSNDILWYEDTSVPGTMLELPGSKNDIDTSDMLSMCEGYQKVFIVNGTKFRVADFVNVKLTHTALGTAHAKGDVLTQATSTATMIVDFTNTAKTATYGYVTSGTFSTAYSITGSGSGTAFTPTGINGMLTHTALTVTHTAGDVLTQDTTGAKMTVEYVDVAKTHTWGQITTGVFNTTNHVDTNGSGSIFTPTATNIKPPNWYTWTVYPGGSSGTLPNKAYIVSMFRGSIYLAGNPEYPNQWYKSRTNNPWDFNTSVSISDALRPMRGGVGDMGESQDIIRALAPYRDDYQIIGGANSLSIMTGDPAERGSINSLDKSTGIFGSTSWCWGPNGEFYFWGHNGFYVATIPGSITCITAITLPNLVKDEIASPTTHRISMVFDVLRNGILICITKLSDGTNSNYFYDLNVREGLVPETYPEECGVYSLFYYPANVPTYADLLVGCKDGYIRKFDETAKSDDIGATDEAIDSYVAFGPVQLSKDLESSSISNISVVTGGGATSGTHTDSNDVVLKVFVADTAEEVMEKLDANSTPDLVKTMNNSCKKTMKDSRKVRGTYAGVRVGNDTVAQTWAFEKLIFETGN